MQMVNLTSLQTPGALFSCSITLTPQHVASILAIGRFLLFGDSSSNSPLFIQSC